MQGEGGGGGREAASGRLLEREVDRLQVGYASFATARRGPAAWITPAQHANPAAAVVQTMPAQQASSSPLLCKLCQLSMPPQRAPGRVSVAGSARSRRWQGEQRRGLERLEEKVARSMAELEERLAGRVAAVAARGDAATPHRHGVPLAVIP